MSPAWCGGRQSQNWSITLNFLYLYVLWCSLPISFFSVMLKQSHCFLGLTCTMLDVMVKCHAEGHNSTLVKFLIS